METQEYKGFWWIPTDIENKVAGILYYTPGDEIRLELIGSFDKENDNSIAVIFSAKEERVIHGKSSDGNEITLIDNSCYISYKEKAGFPTSIYKAREIAIGIHISGEDDQRFFKAVVKIPELSYWLYPASVKQVWEDSKNGHSIYVKYDPPSTEEREVGRTSVKDGLSLCLCRNASYNSGEFLFKPTFEQYTSLQIESIRPLSLMDFYIAAVRFEKFLSLATLREVGYSELLLYSEDSKVTISKKNKRPRSIIVDTILHQKPSEKKINRSSFLFSYEQVIDRYQQALQKWFSEDEEFDAIREHFLDSIDYHAPFSYINFLVAIQAVEGYGRRYLKKEYNNFYKSLSPEEKKSSGYLLKCLKTVFLLFKDVKIVKQDTDLNAIVFARNYHSHLLPKQGEPSVDIEKLYHLTDELRKILICCIMSYLGFTNREIDEITNSSNNDLF